MAASVFGLATSAFLLCGGYLSATVLVYVLGGYLIVQGGSNIVSSIMGLRYAIFRGVNPKGQLPVWLVLVCLFAGIAREVGMVYN